MNKLKVFEAFSGYGSQSMALRNLGIDYEVVAISEIDKYAIQAYEAIHGKVNNLGDISRIKAEDIPKHDLFTYSFPCQDISVAGNTKGIVRGQTRSGLLYECERIIENCKPKYLLLENVKNLVGKKFKPQFDEWLNYLESLGYTNYWKTLNAKDFGVPQNRERVFVVSILGEHKPYEFPEPIPLTKVIKDILEDNVNEKYYLSEETMKKIVANSKFLEVSDLSVKYKGNDIELPCIGMSVGRNMQNPTSRKPGLPTTQMLELNVKGTSNTLTTAQKDNYVVEPKIVDVGFIKKSENGTKHQSNTVLDGDHLMRALTACDYKSPQLVVVDKNIKPSVKINFEREKYEISNSNKEIYQCKCKNGWQDNKVGIKVSPTLRAGNPHTCVYDNFRIRKLIPKECFRLMGLSDNDIQKIIDSGISVTQQYKMAGNSIVVQVLEHIFKNLF